MRTGYVFCRTLVIIGFLAKLVAKIVLLFPKPNFRICNAMDGRTQEVGLGTRLLSVLLEISLVFSSHASILVRVMGSQ